MCDHVAHMAAATLLFIGDIVGKPGRESPVRQCPFWSPATASTW